MNEANKNEANKAIKDFLEASRDETDKMKLYLKKRNFIEIKDTAIKFLKQTEEYLLKYEELDNPGLKRVFLENLTNAWEIADASNIFNNRNLSRAYTRIKGFSRQRFEEICRLNQGLRANINSPSESQDKEYWQEIIRSCLIFIGEMYRAQKELDECQKHLSQLFTFIKNRLKPAKNYRPNVIEAQCHYYSAKVARFQGNLYKSERELIAACENLRDEAKKLSKSEINEDIIEDRLNQIQLLSGVLEVSHAWLNFSQGRYESAKYTALNALLMLAGSKDRLTQLHAELVIAAAKRATAKDANELKEVVTELDRLRKKFEGKHKHQRLEIKTDYEFVLALIILDSVQDSPDVRQVIKEPLSDAFKTLVKYRKKEGISARWSSLLNTLESRYLRRDEMKKPLLERNFQKALEAAGAAYEKAEEAVNLLCRVEALFSRGEIYFQMYLVEKRRKNENTDYLEKAQMSFEKANELCSGLGEKGGFRELQGAIKLYLARISISANRPSFAKYYLEEFRVFKNIEHAWLRRFHRHVINELEKTDTETLRVDSTNWSVMETKLKRLVIEKARSELEDERKATGQEISKAMGISRITLIKWQKELDEN